MSVDPVGLFISSADLIGGGVIAVYLLRRLKREVAFGFAGSIVLLGLIALGATYGLIAGTLLWLVGGSGLIIFAVFFYVAAKKSSTKS